MDGFPYRTDETGDPLYLTDFESLIEDKVVKTGGGDAPQSGVEAAAADANTDDDAYFTVSQTVRSTSSARTSSAPARRRTTTRRWGSPVGRGH